MRFFNRLRLRYRHLQVRQSSQTVLSPRIICFLAAALAASVEARLSYVRYTLKF